MASGTQNVPTLPYSAIMHQLESLPALRTQEQYTQEQEETDARFLRDLTEAGIAVLGEPPAQFTFSEISAAI